jgi:hypothetical protein
MEKKYETLEEKDFVKKKLEFRGALMCPSMRDFSQDGKTS